MRVFVTGSTGFLGGRLIQFLSQRSTYQLVLGTRDLNKIPAQFSHLDAAAIDWTSQEQLELVCSSIDCVIHLAGMNAGQCARASAEELAADVKATERLINAAVKQKVKRFIYLSSAHVYSPLLSGHITELTEPVNTHPYAINHRAKELLVLQAADKYGIEAVVVRLSNAFGVPVDCKADCWMLLVNDLCKQLVVQGQIMLNTSGLQQRDFVTITDFCNAVDHLLNLSASRLDNGVFNLGGRWTSSVLDMAKLVAGRFFLLSGFQPLILFSNKVMDNVYIQNEADKLNFICDKIFNSGFRWSDKSKIEQEIDELILFCRSCFN